MEASTLANRDASRVSVTAYAKCPDSTGWRVDGRPPRDGLRCRPSVEWHADPAVAAFWDDRTFTREEMLARLARFDVDAYLIEAAGKPVGYLQAWLDDEAANCGIDMFLIPSARGRGLGPDSARALARFLLHEAGRMRVTVDPYVWNERAIRAWKKAGFVRSRSAGQTTSTRPPGC
ncbi:MAG TPA: GNAT family N-acetyltransferase [Gaiellaceae bacterium]|nr:GNAT family N-acetyltransferase [Gaiellaceae bacterium]